jgi:hypothetical protein
LKAVDPSTFNRFINFNFAGEHDIQGALEPTDLLVWNLGSEGTTVRADMGWQPLIRMIRPERVFIMRGALESILRPACALEGTWPWWVPRPWRGAVSLDPRCYFSTKWWRSSKQRIVDWIRQRVRYRLLSRFGGKPLEEPPATLEAYRELVGAIRATGGDVVIVGLLPVSDQTFPGSSTHFRAVNAEIRRLAGQLEVPYIDWEPMVAPHIDFNRYFYRDGFHPNGEGADYFGSLLYQRLAAIGKR